MARRPGGYKRSDNVEWAECSRMSYGEAVVSANRMGQDPFVWMNDAIAHHVYRCELLEKQAQYKADVQHAHDTNGISPQPYEDRYQVTRPKPEITRQGAWAGQGSGPGRSYRP